MTFRFASLGSGSKGNGTLVEAGGVRVLVDCGFGLKDTQARLARLGLEAGQLDAILVTHEHSDHAGGVARLARRFNLPVYGTHGTVRRMKNPENLTIRSFDAEACFEIGSVRVTAFSVPHDAVQPCQFRFDWGGRSLGVLSDLGHVTPHVTDALRGLDALMLEFNHDPQMLRDGPYPPALRARVAGDWGHLSNAQAAALLGQLPHQRLQHLWLTHLSETNNTPAHALMSIEDALGAPHRRARCATQLAGFGWCEVVG